MQNISRRDIEERYFKLCNGLKDNNKSWLHYSEAVYVINTLYRTFGVNMGSNVLSAIKKAADDSKNNQIHKDILLNIVYDDKEDGFANHITVTPRVVYEDDYKRDIRVVRSVVEPERIKYSAPYVNRTIEPYNVTRIETNTRPSFTGTRKSLTFRTTLSSVGNPYTYERKSVTDSSNVRVVRTSNYGRRLNNTDGYTRVYVQENPVESRDYRVVDESRIKRVQLRPSYYESSNNTYTDRVLTHKNGHLYESEIISLDSNRFEERRNSLYRNNREYISDSKGYTVRYNDYSTRETPYLNNSSNRRIVYQIDGVRKVY